MRCNERRPRCGHCERLNLDCTWNRPSQARSSSGQSSQLFATASPLTTNNQSFNPNLATLDGFGLGSSNFFDFSGPLGMGTWDEAMLLSPNSWPADPSVTAATTQMETVPQPIYQLPLGHQSSGPLVEASSARHQAVDGLSSRPDRGQPHMDAASTSPFSAENVPNGHVDEEFLLNTFLQMLMPPILTPVEIGPKWASTRAFFGTMAGESSIVRSAIMAFAAMQMQRSGLSSEIMKTDWRPLYDTAARQLSNALARMRKDDDIEKAKTGLKHFLASFFLLTYTDVSHP